MNYLGLDLTSAFPRSTGAPRPIDVAILSNSLDISFKTIAWPPAELVVRRDFCAFLGRIYEFFPRCRAQDLVLCIDGPQGLAESRARIRQCEVQLSTPGRTPNALPPADATGPFEAYIRSSIDLFAGLLRASPSFRLVGLDSTPIDEANLFEAFPGAEWTTLAGARIPKKASREGRSIRRRILELLSVKGLPSSPTPDQNDAALCAYLAYRTRNHPNLELIGKAPRIADQELREGYILHARFRVDLQRGEVEGFKTKEEGPDPDPPAEPDEWTATDHDLCLKITDAALVYGAAPENWWLTPKKSYRLSIKGDDAGHTVELLHSAGFPGGRGWTMNPSVSCVLEQMNRLPARIAKTDPLVLSVDILEEF